MIIDCRTTKTTGHWWKRAYLDGAEVKDCFYVDTDEGVVGHYLRDPDRRHGAFLVDFDTGRPVEAWTFEADVEVRDIGSITLDGQVVGVAADFEIT